MEAEPAIVPPPRRFRAGAVALVVAGVLAVAAGGWFIAPRVVDAARDPYAANPELGLPASSYVEVPPIGRTYHAGEVDVVLMSAVRLEDGGTALHLVLRSNGSLPTHRIRLVPAKGDKDTTDTCAGSGRTGWGECIVRVVQGPGQTVSLNLIIEGRPRGFELSIPR